VPVGPDAPRAVGCGPTGFPQTPQNRNPGWIAAPHAAQIVVSRDGVVARSEWPQSRQYAELGSFSRPHRGQGVGVAMAPL
jgi:hypothetical protein